MKIVVIGWYGTETIGDRAIFAGLLRVFSMVYDTFTVSLGSLYPSYTHRTLYEDMPFYCKCANTKEFHVSIFNSQSSRELKAAIRESDLLVVGGGPLMDLDEMHMLEYAFLFAKRLRKKTALLGCGWGPLKSYDKVQVARRLVDLADLVIFRDKISKCQSNSDKVFDSIDPAFFACQFFMKQIGRPSLQNHIAVNFRDVAYEGANYAQGDFSAYFSEIIHSIRQQTSLPITLVPMHNFDIGGDDRLFLYRIKQKLIDVPDVIMDWETKSLYDTMLAYYDAFCCVGMRFHSIVLQTVLNGNNFIVDYTDPKKGKIIGMLSQLDALHFYKERYCSLYDVNDQLVVKLSQEPKFQLHSDFISKHLDTYCSLIKHYLL